MKKAIGLIAAVGLAFALGAAGCNESSNDSRFVDPPVGSDPLVPDPGAVHEIGPLGERQEDLSSQANAVVMGAGYRASGSTVSLRCGMSGCICKVKGSPDCSGIGSACGTLGATVKCTMDYDCPTGPGGSMQPCHITEGNLCWCFKYPPSSDPNEPFGKRLFQPGVYKTATSSAIYRYEVGRTCQFTGPQWDAAYQPCPTVLDGFQAAQFLGATAEMATAQWCSYAQAGVQFDVDQAQWFPGNKYYRSPDGSIRMLIGNRACYVTGAQWNSLLGGAPSMGLTWLSVAASSAFVHAFDTAMTCYDDELLH